MFKAKASTKLQITSKTDTRHTPTHTIKMASQDNDTTELKAKTNT